MTEVRVPTLGESVSEATIATWFKKPGDRVEADEMLCELETDKVTVEVPSPAAGTLDEIVAQEGETVGVDALLAHIAEAGNAGPEKTEPRKDEDKQGGYSGADAEKGEKADKKADAEESSSGGEDAGGSGEEVEVKVPTLGESVSEATIATWFKKEGDTVEADEMLAELETDKVSVEVPAPAAGTLSKILKQEGETVEPGGVLAMLTEGAGGGARKASGEAKSDDSDSDGKPTRKPPGFRCPLGEEDDGGEGPLREGREGVRQGRPHHEGGRPQGPGTGWIGPQGRRAQVRAAQARAVACRGCRPRGAGQDDPTAPDHRQAPRKTPRTPPRC